MKLSQNGNCLAGGLFTFPTYISELYVAFDYYHKSNNYFIVEWSDGTNVTSIRFDTVNNLIYFSDYSVFSDFAQLGYPYSYWYSLPHTFEFSDGSWHSIRIDYSVNNHSAIITIDSIPVASVSNPSHFKARMLSLAFGQWNTGTTYAKVDNVVVYSSAVSKIIPQLSFYVSPGYTITSDQTVTVQCFANYPDVPLTLYHFSTPVSNPFSGTLSVGMHYFDCVSTETDVYYSTSAPALINVTSAITPTPQVPEPIPAINKTEWHEAGYDWALPFFTPLFIVSFVIAVVSGVIARIGGMTVGGIAGLLMVLVLTLFGIYPAWLGIVFIIIAGFIITKFVIESVGK
jgi:hypothetical protein